MGDTKEKVFCGECIHFNGLRACWNYKHVQYYPQNDTPLVRAFSQTNSGDCMVLNAVNTCTEFSAR